jgi:hypothetical protein
MPQNRILSFETTPRLEWQGDYSQEEAEQQ